MGWLCLTADAILGARSNKYQVLLVKKRHHYVWIMSVRHQCMWRPTVYPGRQASFESAWSGEELNQVGEPSLKLF